MVRHKDDENRQCDLASSSQSDHTITGIERRFSVAKGFLTGPPRPIMNPAKSHSPHAIEIGHFSLGPGNDEFARDGV